MASSLGELFIELGVFADTKELEEFEKKLKKVNDSLKKTQENSDKNNGSMKKFAKVLANFIPTLIATVYAVNKLIDSLVQTNQEFLNLTRNTDIALSTFQKWNNIGRMFGVRNAAQQIENLNQKLFELKLTGQGAEGFMLAGINPLGQDAEGVMEQLRNRVSGLSDTAATFLLTQMGLDPSMLHLLRMTREEFEKYNELQKRYNLNNEQVKDIQAMNAELQIARMKLQYLKDRALLKIMPYFVQFMQSITRIGVFLGKIINKLSNFAVVIGLVLSKFKPFVNFVKTFGAELGVLISKIPIVGRLLGSLGGIVSRALLPFLALYAVLDDIITFMEGGDSVLGDIVNFFKEGFEEFLNADSILEKLLVFLNGIGEAIEHIGEALQNLFNNIFAGGWDFTKLGEFLGGKLADLITRSNSSDNPPMVTPAMNQNIDNSKRIDQRKNQNQQNTFTVHNIINTSETGSAVIDELAYLQNTAYSYL